ncbi:uncharacterized protein LOC111254204 [Varroa destructor]|uniref:Uncharacterized protein n=1 Tax=Varroa destructor TaxID=109461 RepID=A0A7M7L573_VARDE|nr:uncharacterized protein LOC111254204 [Varroa destructor]
MSADLRRRRLRPWAEAARLVLGAQEALPIATIFERIQERGLRDTTPGSKECLFSMMRAHSRGPHSMFYRRLLLPADGQGAPTICFGLRSDLPPSTTIVETDADTDDESRHDSRFKPKVQLLKVDAHGHSGSSNNANSSSLANGASIVATEAPGTAESEAENVAPDDIVAQQLPQLKRKAPGQDETPPPKRCLRPKPQRNSDEKGPSVEEHVSVSSPERASSPFAGSSASGGAANEDQPQQPSPAATTAVIPICAVTVDALPQIMPMVTEILSTPHTISSNPSTRSSSAGSGLSSRSGRVAPTPSTNFRTMREMLTNLSDQCGIRLNRRPGKKMTLSQQLEEAKRGFVDLETPDSILAGVNVKELLSTYAFSLLPRTQQRQLLALLPPVELTRRNQEALVRMGNVIGTHTVSPTEADVEVNIDSALNNEFFASACQEWRDRLTLGDLTPESQLKQKADFEKHLRSVDGWKRRNFEIVWGTSAASRAESAIEEREHLFRIRREHEENLAEQENLRLAALEAKRRSDELAKEAAAAAAAVAAELLSKELQPKLESLKPVASPIIKVERPPVTEPPLPPPPPSSITVSSNPSTKPSAVAAAAAVAIAIKSENDTEEELLAKEEARIATLLPYCSETLHEVLAEHGVPVSANHRRKCNNLVPPSLCLAARRVGLRLLPPPKCSLPSPVAIPRRRLAFHRAASHRLVLDELVTSESRARFERECRQLADHLQRVDWLIDNPPPVTVPVPLTVHELMADMLTLVESDRVTYYPLLPGVVDFGPSSGVLSGGSHSYATSTVGTPSHAGTNVDENFGSELMFSVATDEEPPTDMSDDAIGSELSESRPTTAIDHLLDTSGALADIENMDRLELSARTVADPDVAMLSEDDTRDATTPEPANKRDSFAVLTSREDTHEELRPEDVPLLGDSQQADEVRLAGIDEPDPACESNFSEGNIGDKVKEQLCEQLRSIKEKDRHVDLTRDDNLEEPSGLHPSQSEDDDEDGSPDCVILDEEDFSDPAASPEIVTADRPLPCPETLLPDNQSLDHRITDEKDRKALRGRSSDMSPNLDYYKDDDDDDHRKQRLLVSKNGDDKGIEGGDEAEEMEESLEIETSEQTKTPKSQRGSESHDENRHRLMTPENERTTTTTAGSGNLQVLPKEGEPSGESEHQCTPTQESNSIEPTEQPTSSANDDNDLGRTASPSTATLTTDGWSVADDGANTPPLSVPVLPESVVSSQLDYQALRNQLNMDEDDDEDEVEAAEDQNGSPPTSDATLSDEDTDIDTLLPGGGRGTADDDLKNCETASDSTIEEDEVLHSNINDDKRHHHHHHHHQIQQQQQQQQQEQQQQSSLLFLLSLFLLYLLSLCSSCGGGSSSGGGGSSSCGGGSSSCGGGSSSCGGGSSSCGGGSSSCGGGSSSCGGGSSSCGGGSSSCGGGSSSCGGGSSSCGGGSSSCGGGSSSCGGGSSSCGGGSSSCGGVVVVVVVLLVVIYVVVVVVVVVLLLLVVYIVIVVVVVPLLVVVYDVVVVVIHLVALVLLLVLVFVAVVVFVVMVVVFVVLILVLAVVTVVLLVVVVVTVVVHNVPLVVVVVAVVVVVVVIVHLVVVVVHLVVVVVHLVVVLAHLVVLGVHLVVVVVLLVVVVVLLVVVIVLLVVVVVLLVVAVVLLVVVAVLQQPLQQELEQQPPQQQEQQPPLQQQQCIVHNQNNFSSDDCSTVSIITITGCSDDGHHNDKQGKGIASSVGLDTTSGLPSPPHTSSKEERLTTTAMLVAAASTQEEPDTSARPASFLSGGGLAPPPLPPRCRAQAAGGFSNRRRRRALSCRDLLIAVEQRKKAGQAANGSPCCLQETQRELQSNGETCGALHGDSNGCVCKLQPMLPCQKCGAFWHSDCIGPSRICSTCLLV